MLLLLKNTILPKIIENKLLVRVRIWIAACATGEEVYL
jgi:chemotaxis methyl-accepting protein methylase